MTSIKIANLALYKLGVSKGVVAMDDATRAAYTTGAQYDHILRYCLTRFPWSFATAYADLYLVAGPVPSDDSLVQAWSSTATYAVGDVVRVASVNYRCILSNLNQTPPNTTYWDADTQTEPYNGDWTYAYRWPSDCLFARRVLSAPGLQRAFDPTPALWRKGRDVNGLLIYSTQPDATLEYTVIDCDALYADDVFIDFLTWRLAAAIAPSMAKNGLTPKECIAYAELTLQTAAVVDARQQQQAKPGEAEWLSVR